MVVRHPGKVTGLVGIAHQKDDDHRKAVVPINGRPRSNSRRASWEADRDGDGKLSKDEAPDRMKEHFDRIDADKSGFIERKELGGDDSSCSAGAPRTSGR